jgi:hypothetical protein
MVDVIVVAPGFWTPRIDMHMCLFADKKHRSVERPRERFPSPRRGGRRHARGLHDDGDAPGLDRLLDCDRYLLRQALLDL